MNKKTMKSIILDGTTKEYLDGVVSKGLSHTANMIITRFRGLGLVVNFGRTFEKLEHKTAVNLSVENIDFVESIKQNSFSFTLNCLFATAKENGVKP